MKKVKREKEREKGEREKKKGKRKKERKGERKERKEQDHYEEIGIADCSSSEFQSGSSSDEL